MNDHQRETTFLLRCIRYGEGNEHLALEEEIIQIQRDERCVQRAVWLMALLTGLAAAGFGYSAALNERYTEDTSQVISRIITALGLASIVCLVVFAGLGMVYRHKLDQRREECRQLVTRCLETRMGKPVATPMKSIRANQVREAVVSTVGVASQDNGNS